MSEHAYQSNPENPVLDADGGYQDGYVYRHDDYGDGLTEDYEIIEERHQRGITGTSVYYRAMIRGKESGRIYEHNYNSVVGLDRFNELVENNPWRDLPAMANPKGKHPDDWLTNDSYPRVGREQPVAGD